MSDRRSCTLPPICSSESSGSGSDSSSSGSAFSKHGDTSVKPWRRAGLAEMLDLCESAE